MGDEIAAARNECGEDEDKDGRQGTGNAGA
jgi:hypothetical protein